MNDEEKKLYGFINEANQHVNLSMRSCYFGNPIVPVLDTGGVEPVEVQFFVSASAANDFLCGMKQYLPQYEEEFDKLSLTWITQEFLNTGNYALVKEDGEGRV